MSFQQGRNVLPARDVVIKLTEHPSSELGRIWEENTAAGGVERDV